MSFTLSGMTLTGGMIVSSDGQPPPVATYSYNMNPSSTYGGYIKYSPGTTFNYSAFTFECWFKLLYVPSNRYMTGGNGNFAPIIGFPDQTTIGVFPMPGLTGNFTVPSISLNTWHNLVVTRTTAYTTYNDPFSAPAAPGTGYFAVAVWLDGALATSGIVLNSGGSNQMTTPNTIIGWYDGASASSNFNGKISSLRWSNTCRFFPYTGSAGNLTPVSTIAVPTSAYTTDSDTVLLINPTSSTVTDDSGLNTITVTSGATYDSSDSPFGGSSSTGQALFGFGYTGWPAVTNKTNLVSNTGVVASDVTTAATARKDLAACGYGSTGAGIFGFGMTDPSVATMSNIMTKFNGSGTYTSESSGVGTARWGPAACRYSTDLGIFLLGQVYGGSYLNYSNLVNSVGGVASDTATVALARFSPAALSYGSGKGIVAFGVVSGVWKNTTNLISDTGVVASDSSGVGTARQGAAGAGYGSGLGIFAYGNDGTSFLTTINLVSNTGVMASDTTGAGTARYGTAAASYGGDQAIFGFGDISGGAVTGVTNLVSNTGVVATDTTAVGTARSSLAATALA